MTETRTATSDHVASLLAEIADDFRDRVQKGEDPDVEAYAEQYPALADVLRQVLPALQILRSGSGGVAHEMSGEPPTGILGDFRILREVGRGGMGIVYEAEQISLGRRVALKVLPFAATMDPKHLQRFHNEAKAAASLKHEHIVHVYGVGCERGVHYFAMEFIDGHTLADVITAAFLPSPGFAGEGPGVRAAVALEQPTAPSPLTPLPQSRERGTRDTAPIAALSTERTGPKGREFFRRCAELIADAADALEHAHSLGIVHRDVKPGNLLLDADGKVYVSDFGLARVGPDAGLTMTGDLLGTLRYMAPEQALAKHGLVDHRADVYGLGTTLYELLTGQPAVGGEDKQEILKRIAFEEPVALRKLDKTISAELDTITLKCLEKNPVERYATAGELAADLRRWLGNQTIKAKPATLRQRAARWLRRHKPLVWAAAVVGLVSVAAMVALAGLAYYKNGQLTAAYTEAEQGRQMAWRALDDMSSLVIDDWLARQPLLQTEQKDFLKRALDYYQKFAAGAGDGEDARAAVAAAYRRVGIIQQRLGQVKEAEKAYGHSRETYERLAADFPQNPAYQQSLSESLTRLGHVLHLAGRRAEAEPCLRQALTVGGKLADGFPDVPGYRCDLAGAYYCLGSLLTADRRLTEAEQNFRQALALREKLAADFRDVPYYQDCLAESYQGLGNVLRDQGRLPQAVRALRRTVELREQLYDADRGSPRYRGALADPLIDLGDILRQAGRNPEAEPCYRRSVALTEKLVDDFPAALRYRRNLACGYGGLGDILEAAGRRAEAEAYFRQSRAHLERLTAEAPAVPENHGLLGEILAKLGLLASVGGSGCGDDGVTKFAVFPISVGNSFSLSLSASGYAEAALRQAIKHDPNYAEAHCNLGTVLGRQGKFVEALAARRRGHELGSNQPGWRYPSDEWIRQAERDVEFDAKLARVLDGQARPANVGECVELARLCAIKHLNVTAVRFLEQAFADHPSLTDDLQKGLRYDAACVAALAGCGQGTDVKDLSDEQLAHLRRQALIWLRADLRAWGQELDRDPDQARARAAKAMRHWQGDPDFAVVRDAALAGLPESERAGWRKFWADVADLLKRCEEPLAPSPPPKP